MEKHWNNAKKFVAVIQSVTHSRFLRKKKFVTKKINVFHRMSQQKFRQNTSPTLNLQKLAVRSSIFFDLHSFKKCYNFCFEHQKENPTISYIKIDK